MTIDTQTLFSALSNDIRLRCLMLLQLEGELCVCELTHAMELSQPMISRHLALLRDAHLVSDRRAGVWIYYRINPDLPEWVNEVLQAAVTGSKQQAPFIDDQKRLEHMANRPGDVCCV
ncbi:MAG TPA: metalloregulator ArsR/SmtB family transcription factor [Gammaproteobacteria bacterium]